MNYIVCINILIIITTLFIFTTCGIEDTIYFQEPELLNVENNETANVRLRFNGFNQEKDIDDFLFVGYDIYYYFTSKSGAQLAQVYMPFRDKNGSDAPFSSQFPLIGSNNKLMYFPTDEELVDSKPTEKKYRFPDTFFPRNMITFYQLTTFPVTVNMITNVLGQSRNDNVQIGFGIEGSNGLRDVVGGNPYIVGSGSNSYILLGSVFPNYSEYSDKIWGVNKQSQDIDPDKPFRGFYDKNFYYHRSPKISPTDGEEENDTGGVCKYTVYFYAIAKGFNSNFARNQNFNLSYISNTVQVIFEVQNNTLQKEFN